MNIMSATFLLVFAIAVGYTALYIWRRRNRPDPMDRSGGFRPHIGFSRLDGMESLSLLLANESKMHMWVEEIEIFLTDLVANDQTAEAPFQGIQKIRQMVRSGDTLPISLSEAIYKAAGDPQRKYSCLLSSVLRYRIGEEQLEKRLDDYRLQMMGLTASSAHRERKPALPFHPQGKSQGVSELATKLK